MSKRRRDEVDEASQELIDSLRDTDALEHQLETFENERASLTAVFESSKEAIYKEFKTKDVESLAERDQIRIRTKLEFEQGLLDDRIRALEERIVAFKEKHAEDCSSRKRRRTLDRELKACSKLAQRECKECDWRDIGKNKHMQTTLNQKIDHMTSEQKTTYSNVLKELKEKGWRVLNVSI